MYSSRGGGWDIRFRDKKTLDDLIVCFFEKRNFFWIVYCSCFSVIIYRTEGIFDGPLYESMIDDGDIRREHNKNTLSYYTDSAEEVGR